MKKLLMIAATTAMFSSTALADTENMFYVKANAGANWMQKITSAGIKTKSKAAPIFMLGAGYYVMDNVRADLTIEMVSNPQLKGSGTGTVDGISRKGSVKHKGNVAALMVNAYVDMFDVSVAGIFAGAGVGASRVKDKATVNPDGLAIVSDSTKIKTNVAYQLTVGARGEVAPGVKAELAYSWRDYGKSGKYKSPAFAARSSKIHYRGHNVMAGVTFDL
jgi:opacity protein-like surface antigen